MAEIVGKDPATYSKERDGFLRDLQHFHETKGTPFRRPPILGGREVDLYLLYTLVTSHGGWLKVNSKNSWSEILPHFKLPHHCVNGSVAVKQIYLRYLDRWEKVHYLGEDGERGSDDDEESRHKRWSARALHSVPYTYNYVQHNIAESIRDYNHLSTNLYKPSDYDRLALSLISPLPNEQDFAINVCTLLSNDGKHTLKLDKHPRIVNYLLGHAGIYNHVSLRKLFTHVYSDIRKHPINSFWSDVLESKEFLDLTCENKANKGRSEKDKTKTENATSSSLLTLSEPMEVDSVTVIGNKQGNTSKTKTSAPVTKNVTDEVCIVCESDSDCEIIDDLPKELSERIKFDVDAADEDLFCLKRTLGTQDYVGQRVLQVATILRNLSFIEENIPVFSKNTNFIRFLLLCSNSQWNVLKNLGLDMLGNLAGEILVKDAQADIMAAALLKIICNGLESEDRALIISSLEVLNKLSQNELNEDNLLRCLEPHVYRRVCSFLTIHDVMLLIYTLECLYSLSSLGEKSCNFIMGNHGVLDTLVSLVTVEGKSYGPKACIGMKLVETVTGTVNAQQSNVQQTQVQQQPQQQTTTSSATITTSVTTSVVTTTIMTNASPIKAVVSPTTPVRTVPVAPQRLITVTPAVPSTSTATVTTVQTSQAMTPQQLMQQQHAHQQAIHENEQFALAWLRATYEPALNGKIDHQELYKHYLNSCSKIGRRGVISPLHFPRCVRSVFGGTVGPNPMKPANPNEPQYYEGIKVRPTPLIISMPASSPIQSVSSAKATPASASRRKAQSSPARSPAPSPVPVPVDGDASVPISPSSPILKAQLSAPPKQRDAPAVVPATVCTKGDAKSQVMAHPHLSQALLGNNTLNTSTATSSTTKDQTSQQQQQQQQTGQSSNTSLIKSLLANKVNDCMPAVSMKTADCQNVAQVAARQQQQRLLAQQVNTPDAQKATSNKSSDTPKSSRLNGARQLFNDGDVGDPSVSSTSQFTSTTKGKKEPPQPPPPPLAPLSNNVKGGKIKVENEDSDSLGNNSLSSSTGGGCIGTVGVGGISSTEDGENSLTSFEGLLNGVPNIDTPLNEDSNNSKDSVNIVSSEISINKPLRLADLLEKKFEKSPPMLNGALCKDLRLGDKTGLDLVENHIEKALRDSDCHVAKTEVVKEEEKKEDLISIEKPNLKRSASDDIVESESKKPLLSNVNGSKNPESPAPDSVSSSNGEEGATASTAAAKLFADLAADILEDEDEEQLLQAAITPSPAPTIIESQTVQIAAAPGSAVQQIVVDGNQQMVMTQPRQIIVSQGQVQQTNQVVLSTGTQIKPAGQTVIMNTGQQRNPMVIQQNTGQFLLSSGIQGQMQLVASSQPGQYVLQTSGGQGAYMVAQPQTAVVHGQQQTVLVAQTSQQQGTGAKTIIILQQQPTNNVATHHQKVVVTPQGQQMVVTQVPRPMLQTSSVANNSTLTSGSKTVKSATVTNATPSTNGVTVVPEKKEEPKPKIIRDLTTAFVCEWGDCSIDIKFTSANQVYMHACEAHCPPTCVEEIECQWDRCDSMKRKRFSLMTHLHDKHCNTESMKQSLIRRKKEAQGVKVEPPPPASGSPHPGYAPDAALHAIKRHALEFVNPKELQNKSPKQSTPLVAATAARPGPTPPEQDDNEGPVTKSIRLTASLILRNLVIYSTNCRRYLKGYESHLANVALSNVESSRTIAQILYDMNDNSTHR